KPQSSRGRITVPHGPLNVCDTGSPVSGDHQYPPPLSSLYDTKNNFTASRISNDIARHFRYRGRDERQLAAGEPKPGHQSTHLLPRKHDIHVRLDRYDKLARITHSEALPRRFVPGERQGHPPNRAPSLSLRG